MPAQGVPKKTGKVLFPGNRDFGVGYPITIAQGSLDSMGGAAREVHSNVRWAVFTDSTVGGLYAKRAISALGEDAQVFTIPPGEAEKTRQTWGWLTDQLLSQGFGRDSCLVALGGGVIGDLTGFVAGTYMRGIPFIQVPTTLLAMVDASIGGKTGVDTPSGKNLVGLFHRPSTVIIDPQVLATLSLKHLCSGLAEVIKHGVIADRNYFESVAQSIGKLIAPDGWSSEAMASVIVRSVQIKAEVVASDERESGRRRILNFGHTIGHAVEAASSYSILHGEAVAIGMALESRLAERSGIADPGTAELIVGVLTKAGLPRLIPDRVAAEAVLERMQSDKKNRSGKVEFALPESIGKMFEADGKWSVSLDTELIREVLNEKN